VSHCADEDIVAFIGEDALPFVNGKATVTIKSDTKVEIAAGKGDNSASAVYNFTVNYPTEIASPVFNVEGIGDLTTDLNGSCKANAYAGQKVSVKCETLGSTLEWSLAKNGGEKEDLTELVYTIPSDAKVDDIYTFMAKASVQGKEGLLVGEATLTLEIVETPVSFVDVLNAVNFGSPSSYGEVTYTESTSGVEYKGYMTTNAYGDMQMRSSSTPHAGIIVNTNKNGYALQKMEIEWGTGGENKELDIYYSPKAFAAINDMWSIKAGSGVEKIGTFVNNADSAKSMDFDGRDVFIGMRSNDGALYIKSIKLTWSKPAAPVAPEFDGVEVNDNTIVASGKVSINFKKMKGATIYYRLNEKQAQGVTPKAEEAITVDHATHDGFTAHTGEAIEANTNHASIDFFACDSTTGLHSPVRTVAFDITTGIDDVEVAEEGEAVYFNLQGVRVAEPAEGLYIRVINGKAEKVILK